MGYEPRLIAPYKSALSKYYQPWIIGEDAFPEMSNAYVWRGAVRKREGYTFFSELPDNDFPVQGIKNWINPQSLSTTSIIYSITKSYRFNPSSSQYEDITFYANPMGVPFSWHNTVDQYFWTSNFAASMWSTNNRSDDHIAFWNGTPAAGWNVHQPTVSGTTTLNASLIVLPYKGRLVVLNTLEGNNSFAGRARWSQIGTPYTSNVSAVNISNITAANPAVVSVTDTSGFTIGLPAGITNVLGSMSSLLNFNQYNVLAINPGTSVSIDVDTTGLTYVSGGLIQGAGTTVPPIPYQISIFGWRDDISGRGGYIDADTSERIVSADIVKDILVVFFQRSTWRLRYTGNEVLPFIWERLNTQYGSESTFSNIAFDEAILAFSRYGWIASDTNDVARIDLNIPDNCFSVDSTNSQLTGLTYVQGIRDYFRQFAYWTFPDQNLDDGENRADQIYAYNYIDKTWSIFTPSIGIRTFGTFVETTDKTWANLSTSLNTWFNYSNLNSQWQLLSTSQNSSFPVILGGDSLGNIFKMFEFQEPSALDYDGNIDVTFGFSFSTKRFNPYISEGTKCRVGYVDLYCTLIAGGQITFKHFIDDQLAPVIERTVLLSPRNLRDITLVIPGATPTSTIINVASGHGLTVFQQVTISNVVGTIAPIINNQTFMAFIIDETNFEIGLSSAGYTYTSGGYIYQGNLPNSGQLNYTRVYLGAIAHMHQFEISVASDTDQIIGSAQFELQGMVLWTKRAGRIRG